ncbi:hypothetical protein AC622_17285 [Bacillus sp. FJAT-27916]|uniref:iron-containing alcohol dehydrogenase n=1 Tax=Bacillaceae TaxID=186817 RepID=UPI00069E909A|nr:iron-containing alcohol dehydrogenase [Bacillus sp. FJAT-27916]KMY45737.1 hypothetical protein AC622_17285 [Bacillus sp. FJAT-27916]
MTGGTSAVQLIEAIQDMQIAKPFIMISSKLMVDAQSIIFPALEKEEISFHTYICDTGEPTFLQVRNAIGRAEAKGCDGVAAIGGGSVIDLAKAVSIFILNPQHSLMTIQHEADIERLPLIAIPTTAGSGSEATSVMVITDNETGIKLNPSHPAFIPDAAILDPYWTQKLSPAITAYTGLDALTHAMEAYVSTKANDFSDFYALQAIIKITNNLPEVYNKTTNPYIYDEMLLGSLYAGIAFSNSSTNLAHAAGRALGAKYQLPHGLSVALIHPFVIEYSLESAEERYAEIAVALGHSPNLSKADLAKRILMLVRQYNRRFHIWEAGRQFIQIEDELLPYIQELAELALLGNGIATNRKQPTREDIERLFEQLLHELVTDGIH